MEEMKMKIVEGLYYSNDHEWAKVQGGEVYVGITDYAQHSMGDIVYIELPEVGAVIEQGGTFGVIESVKAASDLYLPVSGTVTKVNDGVAEDPALINQDAFENWMICIEMSNPEELNALMDASGYQEFCGEEE
jgi:glycine cleavage system H protein